MWKIDMVRRIAEETGLTQVTTADVVETIFDEIKDALQHGDSVILRGFGTFHVRDKPRFLHSSWLLQSSQRIFEATISQLA